jgi:hypothetical protein
MDILAIVLIVVAVLALSGWGYGTYAARPAVPAGAVVEGPAPWVNPLGIIGLLVVVAVVVMLLTGWPRQIIIAP